MRRPALLLIAAVVFAVFAATVIVRRVLDEREGAEGGEAHAVFNVTPPEIDAETEAWLLELAPPTVPPEAPPLPEYALGAGRERAERDAILEMAPAKLATSSAAELSEALTHRLAAREAFVGVDGLTVEEKQLRLAKNVAFALTDSIDVHLQETDEATIEAGAIALEDLGVPEAAELYLRAIEESRAGNPPLSANEVQKTERLIDAAVNRAARDCLRASRCLVELGLGESETVATFPEATALAHGGDEVFIAVCEPEQTRCGIHAVAREGAKRREVVSGRTLVQGLSLGSRDVVWAERGHILAAPRAGGPVRSVVSFVDSHVDSLAVAGDEVWFSVSRSDPPGIGARQASGLSSVSLSGPPPSRPAARVIGHVTIYDVQAMPAPEEDGVHVFYFAQETGLSMLTSRGQKLARLTSAEKALWIDGDEVFVQHGGPPSSFLGRIHRVTGDEVTLVPGPEYSAFARTPTGYVAIRERDAVEVRVKDGARVMRTIGTYNGTLIDVVTDDTYAWVLIGAQERSSRLLRVPYAERLRALRTANR